MRILLSFMRGAIVTIAIIAFLHENYLLGFSSIAAGAMVTVLLSEVRSR